MSHLRNETLTGRINEYKDYIKISETKLGRRAAEKRSSYKCVQKHGMRVQGTPN